MTRSPRQPRLAWRQQRACSFPWRSLRELDQLPVLLLQVLVAPSSAQQAAALSMDGAVQGGSLPACAPSIFGAQPLSARKKRQLRSSKLSLESPVRPIRSISRCASCKCTLGRCAIASQRELLGCAAMGLGKQTSARDRRIARRRQASCAASSTRACSRTSPRRRCRSRQRAVIRSALAQLALPGAWLATRTRRHARSPPAGCTLAVSAPERRASAVEHRRPAVSLFASADSVCAFDACGRDSSAIPHKRPRRSAAAKWSTARARRLVNVRVARREEGAGGAASTSYSSSCRHARRIAPPDVHGAARPQGRRRRAMGATRPGAPRRATADRSPPPPRRASRSGRSTRRRAWRRA